MKLVVGFKPSYKKNRRSNIGRSFGPFVSSLASALMGQAIYWTKIFSTLGLSSIAFLSCITCMVGWASLPKKKKKLQNTRRMIICRTGLNGSGPKWIE